MKAIHKPWLVVTIDGTQVIGSPAPTGTATILLTLSEVSDNLYDSVNDVFKKGAPFNILDYVVVKNTIVSDGVPINDIHTLLGNFPHQPASEVLTIDTLIVNKAAGKYPTLTGNIVYSVGDADNVTGAAFTKNLS